MVYIYFVGESVKFSAGEFHGCYLDLNPFYELCLNLPQFERCDFIQYLSKFSIFHIIPRSSKLTPAKKAKEYKEYLIALKNYLRNFINRIHPLSNLNEVDDLITQDTQQQWANKTLAGWADIINGEANTTQN